MANAGESTEIPSRAGGYVLVALAASGWGTWPLILRRAPMPATLQSAVVFATLAIASFPVMMRERRRMRRSRSAWAAVLWLGVGGALNTALFFAACQRTTVAVAVLTHYLAPILVALVAPMVVGEKARARTFVAVAVAFLGLGVLLEPWRAGIGRADLVGAALGAASAVFYASYVLVNKRLAASFSGSELMFFHALVAALILFALVEPAAYGAASPGALATVVLGAVGPGAIGGLAFVWGLRRIAASHASVLTLLEPFVAVILATSVLGERVGSGAIFGGALILAGAVVVVTGTTRGEAPSIR